MSLENPPVATNGSAKLEGKEEEMDVGDENGVDGGVTVAADVKEETNKTAGTYKVKVSGLPKFYPLGEFKKLVKDDLGLALTYIRSPKKGNPWLHLTFSTHEEQQKALTALDQYSWRKRTLSCNVLQGLDSNGKRKPEDNVADDSEAKKAKLDLSVEERVLMVTIPLHNVPYEEQLKTKMTELRALIGRLGDLLVRRNPALTGWAEQQRAKCGGLAFKLEEIMPSPVIDAYRNKCELRAGINPETQERTVGCRLDYFKEGKVGVGPADSFKHLPQQIREAVKIFQDYVRASDKGPFIVEKNEGYWRHLVVRCTSNGELMIVVVAHPQSLTPEEIVAMKEDLKDFFLNREGKACNVVSLYFQLFTEKLVGRPLPEMEQLFGKTHLEETLLGVTFHLSPSSYFQVNTRGAEVLYNVIIKMIEPTQDTTVLDLCCGTGGIGLCVAKLCGKVFGIEYLEQNIEDAKYNAEKNNITNCEFIAGRVEDILPTLEEKLAGQNIIPILDPPRTGLNQKVLCQLRKMTNVRKMVYICSNHKAPIRNFLVLCCPEGKVSMEGQPFVPTLVVPVDVAPHTMHAQMVVLLERVDPATLPPPTRPPALPVSRRGVVRGRGGLMMTRGRGAFMLRGRGPMPLLRGGFRPAPPLMRRPMPHPRPAPLLRPLPLMRHRARGFDARFAPPPLVPRRREYMPEYPPRIPEYASRVPEYAPRVPEYAHRGSEYGQRVPNYAPRMPEYAPRIPEYAPRIPKYAPRAPEYNPRVPNYASRMPDRAQMRRPDFSSDDLALSRYSDFRRDVEDAIDSYPLMLQREQRAYEAGLNRGLLYHGPGPRGAKRGVRRARAGRR